MFFLFCKYTYYHEEVYWSLPFVLGTLGRSTHTHTWVVGTLLVKSFWRTVFLRFLIFALLLVVSRYGVSCFVLLITGPEVFAFSITDRLLSLTSIVYRFGFLLSTGWMAHRQASFSIFHDFCNLLLLLIVHLTCLDVAVTLSLSLMSDKCPSACILLSYREAICSNHTAHPSSSGQNARYQACDTIPPHKNRQGLNLEYRIIIKLRLLRYQVLYTHFSDRYSNLFPAYQLYPPNLSYRASMPCDLSSSIFLSQRLLSISRASFFRPEQHLRLPPTSKKEGYTYPTSRSRTPRLASLLKPCPCQTKPL